MIVGIIGNLSPGIIGDNPEFAYKSPEEIRQYLPLGEAVYHTTLKTLVNHKEGIHYRDNTRFAQFCVQAYAGLNDDEKLWLDVGLVRSEKGCMPIYLDQLDRIRCFECTNTMTTNRGHEGQPTPQTPAPPDKQMGDFEAPRYVLGTDGDY